MKKIKIYFLLLMMLAGTSFFAGCEKEDTADLSRTVKVTHPVITLSGPSVVHIGIGAAYTDEGAVFDDGIAAGTTPIPASEAENEVNSSAPGIYAVKYTKKNGDGFEATATRTVLVLDYTPPGGLDPNFDLSGTYLRAATGTLSEVVKIDNGLYVMQNFAGSTLVYPAYFTTPDVSTIDVPPQVSYGGYELDCTAETLTYVSPTDITFSWKAAAAGFGTGTRTFVKQ